jgi:hypothetical protein
MKITNCNYQKTNYKLQTNQCGNNKSQITNDKQITMIKTLNLKLV